MSGLSPLAYPLLRHVDFVKFLVAISAEIEARKSTQNFANISQHFCHCVEIDRPKIQPKCRSGGHWSQHSRVCPANLDCDPVGVLQTTDTPESPKNGKVWRNTKSPTQTTTIRKRYRQNVQQKWSVWGHFAIFRCFHGGDFVFLAFDRYGAYILCKIITPPPNLIVKKVH